MDWGRGRYEYFAPQIAPAATEVVAVLAPAADETVLDLGCGTGNAAALVAGRGATVIGVDPAPRLLAVARGRLESAGADAEFYDGNAASIPLDPSSVDAIVSVFGVIFAPDAAAAVNEMTRVLRPGGRIVMSAWLRDNALAAQARLRSEVVAAVQGTPPASLPFSWHDLDQVTELVTPYGLEVSMQTRSIDFVGESPATYAEEELANHPLWVEARDILEPAGTWDEALSRLTSLFVEVNQDPAAFRLTSRYVIATISGK